VLRIAACILSTERSVYRLVSLIENAGKKIAGVITGQDRSSSSCLRLEDRSSSYRRHFLTVALRNGLLYVTSGFVCQGTRKRSLDRLNRYPLDVFEENTWNIYFRSTSIDGWKGLEHLN
jgi:hypothetical protein